MFKAYQNHAIFLLPLLGLLPILGDDWMKDLSLQIMIYSIFALSLELLVGQVGLVCFGQAAFFGIGAYSVALLSPESSAGNLLLLLPISLGMAGLYAAFVGALSLRTKGAYFIMVTLAFAQMAFYIFHDTPIGRGSDGIYILFKPALPESYGFLNNFAFDLNQKTNFYGFTLISLMVSLYILVKLKHSRFGHALEGIKLNEQRMRASGYSTYLYKLVAFILAGIFAGLAGFLFAVKDGFVNPEMLGWHLSGTVLIMIILGGIGHLSGAILGAASFVILQQFFKSQAIFGDLTEHWHLGLGITIILAVIFLPNGLISIPLRIRDYLNIKLKPIDKND